jgi:hypothetical protein
MAFGFNGGRWHSCFITSNSFKQERFGVTSGRCGRSYFVSATERS